MNPLLFLDVDGVINVSPDHGEKVSVRVQSPKIHPSVAAKLRFLGGDDDKAETFELHAFVPVGTRERLALLSEHFEIIWCTAWFERARALSICLGPECEDWPVVQWDDFKMPKILEMAQGRRWAFLDDDATWDRNKSGVSIEGKEGRDFLLLDPAWETGLDDSHVKTLVQFAQDLR